ncbi:hypothetical protein, partial [Staphylococcus aureus]|uniref:hypothetical protein n=1 Tax=Staphylococcus aureus TaxID=1280 RepID=UPI00210C98D6
DGLAAEGIRVHVHESPANLGSSAGYARLIAGTLALPGAGAAWFLDDDNVPRPGSLALLLDAQAATGGAVSGVRTDRYSLMETARTGGAEPPRPGEAFGIDLRAPFRRAWRNLRGRPPASPAAAVKIPRV